MSRKEEFDWIVTVDASHSADGLAPELTKLGLVVQQVLAAAGIVVVRGTSQQASQARATSGVSDVSKDQPIDIGPPGAEIS